MLMNEQPYHTIYWSVTALSECIICYQF